MHDRRIKNEIEPCRRPSSYLSNGQQVIADNGFQGGHYQIIFLLSRNQYFDLTGYINRDSRKQKISNK